jgi:hypothetical protein
MKKKEYPSLSCPDWEEYILWYHILPTLSLPLRALAKMYEYRLTMGTASHSPTHLTY